MAARLLVVSHWKSETIPEKEEWMPKVQNMLLMSKLTDINRLRMRNLKAMEEFLEARSMFINYWHLNCHNSNITLQVLEIL